MINVRNMTVSDIPSLKLSEEWMRDRYIPYLESGSPSYIVENEGRPLCAFGCVLLWDGVCEVWYNLISREKTISQIRIIKKYLKEQAESLKIRRMQATIKCSSLVGRKFIEAMGFTLEGKLKKFMPDYSDAFMYARII